MRPSTYNTILVEMQSCDVMCRSEDDVVDCSALFNPQQRNSDRCSFRVPHDFFFARRLTVGSVFCLLVYLEKVKGEYAE